tara:strand:+ start:252 stop:521 length:270 start_codon:yes stop_codon:yes gene_type:complete
MYGNNNKKRIEITSIKFDELLKMVHEDWETQTKDMNEEELNYDRNEWIRRFGISDDDTEEQKLMIDVHTISICLEQILRGGIIYDPPKK